VMIYPMEYFSLFFLFLRCMYFDFSKSKGQVISHMMCNKSCDESCDGSGDGSGDMSHDGRLMHHMHLPGDSAAD
jgi:hypothetical protein